LDIIPDIENVKNLSRKPAKGKGRLGMWPKSHGPTHFIGRKQEKFL
jgi:hypothetical protein